MSQNEMTQIAEQRKADALAAVELVDRQRKAGKKISFEQALAVVRSKRAKQQPVRMSRQRISLDDSLRQRPTATTESDVGKLRMRYSREAVALATRATNRGEKMDYREALRLVYKKYGHNEVPAPPPPPKPKRYEKKLTLAQRVERLETEMATEGAEKYQKKAAIEGRQINFMAEISRRVKYQKRIANAKSNDEKASILALAECDRRNNAGLPSVPYADLRADALAKIEAGLTGSDLF